MVLLMTQSASYRFFFLPPCLPRPWVCVCFWLPGVKPVLHLFNEKPWSNRPPCIYWKCSYNCFYFFWTLFVPYSGMEPLLQATYCSKQSPTRKALFPHKTLQLLHCKQNFNEFSASVLSIAHEHLNIIIANIPSYSVLRLIIPFSIHSLRELEEIFWNLTIMA